MGEFANDFDIERTEMDKPRFVVQRISEGFGFGEGSISGHVENVEVLQSMDTAIEQNPDIIVAIDKDDHGKVIDDDGCGDGRGVRLTTRLGRKLERSLNRAKVFGGAAAMTAASRIGLGKARNRNLNELFDDALDELDEKQIDFGAHTADHVAPGREEKDSGCGAIDGAPAIIPAAVKHENEIRGVIKFLGSPDEGLDEVFDNFKDYGETIPSQPEYRGLRVVNRIKSMGKVLKELFGPHREKRIVINTVPGFTVNQALIREITGGKAQVFAFDSWRLEDIAAKLYPEDTSARQKALLSELVYTLGVASVLTPGDMPVYLIRQPEE